LNIKSNEKMNTSELIYEGDLRTYATHVYSGTKLFTDAPLDNHGKAQSFSPTDLLATSLAACMITIMGIESKKMNIKLDGTQMAVRKIMGTNPRRVIKIEIDFLMPEQIEMSARPILENAAHQCPVAKSIHPDLIQQVTFSYQLK
jgi:uncharacterized OsmC-like protein